MAQYSNLKAYIEEKIYENGTQAITGDILQDVLKVMTDDLGEFYQTGGVASPSTDPGTPDAKVIYFATEAGTYTNFGGITLAAGEVALLIFETSWTKETLNVLSSANGGVKAANLADGAVTTAKIANGAVEEGKIADASVTSGKLGSGAVTTEKIADGAATTDKLADKAVATGKLGDKVVTSGKIADKAVGTGQIADEAITEGKIADDAVTSGKIAENAVTTAKIDNGAVTEAKIQNDAVKTAKIGSKAVTTAKIADKAVTSGQLGDKAVTTDKIADGAVGSDQLAEGAFSAQNLADGSVTTDKLADDAVTAEKIADGAVTAGKFANGSVTTIKLGSGVVTTEKIGDGMVTRQKLADSSVGTSKIIDGAVTGAKLQEGVRPVINVNALNEQSTAYGSAALARAAVPSALRILGLHVIYLLAGGWFEDEFIGSDVSGWGTASNWRAVGPVSVSQNSQTSKTELLIGDTPAFIVDNEPTAGSDNLVKSGGVAEDFKTKVGYITNPMVYVRHGYVGADGWYSVNDISSRHYILEVKEGDVITFEPSYGSYYTMLSSYKEPTYNGESISFAEGYSNRIWIQAEKTLIVPKDANFFYFTNQSPIKLTINGINRLTNDWLYNYLSTIKIQIYDKIKNDNLKFGEITHIGRMAGDGVWYPESTLLLNIKSQQSVAIEISRTSTDGFYYSLLSDYNVDDVIPHFATGYTGRVYASGGKLSIKTPSDAKYLILVDKNDYNKFKVNNLECLNTSVWNRLLNCTNNVFTQVIPKLYPHNNMPCVSLRFDDCADNDVQVFDLFETYKVQCGFAFIASQDNFSQKGGKYLAWNKKGYSLICHSLDWKPLTLQYYNSVADIKNAITTAYFRMKDYGMIVNGFSAPAGDWEEESWNVISNICAYAYKRTYPDIPPYRNTNPCDMNSQGTQNKSLQQIKDEIDNAIENNQYISLYGHANDFGTTYTGTYQGESWEVLYDIHFIENILQYILQKRNNGEIFFGSPDECAKYFFKLT